MHDRPGPGRAGYTTASRTWPEERAAIAGDDVADLRSAGMGITPPGGHPSEYGPPADAFPGDGDHAHDGPPPGYAFPFCSTPAEAAKMIEQQVAQGYNYVKIMIEDGTVVGHPGLPVISDDVLAAAVREAHRHGKLAIAHATTIAGARRAVRAGVDGLGHLFADGPATPDIVADIAGAGTFVIPTLTVLSSATGHAGARFAADERVSSKLSTQWLDALRGCMNVYPQGDLDDAVGAVAALHAAGVDILTDLLTNIRATSGAPRCHLMARAGLGREQGRGPPPYRAGTRITGTGSFRLAGAGLGGGDVGPGAAVGACGAHRGGGGQGERGVDLRRGQGQRPFLAVSGALAVAAGQGQQALGLGVMIRSGHQSSSFLLSGTGVIAARGTGNASVVRRASDICGGWPLCGGMRTQLWLGRAAGAR